MVALNADVVGYSRLLADDPAETAAVMESYHRLVTEKVIQARGTLVNFVGDNFMAVFESATDAMQAAISITTAIEDLNLDRPSHRQVRFRMGMDEGRLVVGEDGQHFGDALNIAARIQSIALPGGLSVSGKVYGALDQPELRFKALGRKDLKNIPEGVQVYQFADLPVSGPKKRRGDDFWVDPPSVAILPIHTESLDESLKPAGALIISDLVHRLASMPTLTVVDASDPHAPEPADGTVDYMLDTGIHQFGPRLRVYAKLVEVNTVNVVFSHRWDTTPEDVFSMSDDMAVEVSNSLGIELVVGEPYRIYAELADPASHENIYMGWFHATSGTREGWLRALDFFQLVEQSHSGLPTGHALLAFTYWMGVAEGFSEDPEGDLDRARTHAKNGIETGDPTGLSQMVEAAILMSEGEADKAMERVESAEITRPTCDVTYALAGSVRRYMGQWEQSLALVDRAMQLTVVTKPWYPTIQSCSLFMGGRVEDSISTAEAVLERQPHNLEALLVLAAGQVELGMDRRARATAELVKDRFPATDIKGWLEGRPYQDDSIVRRWRNDLASIGLIEPD